MINPAKIIRQKRKTLSLTISPSGELVVKAPLFISDSQIYAFIKEKEKWIESKIEKCKKSVTNNERVLSYRTILLFGKEYEIVLGNVKTAKIIENKFVLPSGTTLDEMKKKSKNFYLKQCKKWIEPRVNEIALKIGLSYSDIKFSATRGRWGACTSKRLINLNFRLACLSPCLIDYVIVHELCHLKEMNHSPKFWQEVESILPNYKHLRNKVKDYGFLLKLY